MWATVLITPILATSAALLSATRPAPVEEAIAEVQLPREPQRAWAYDGALCMLNVNGGAENGLEVIPGWRLFRLPHGRWAFATFDSPSDASFLVIYRPLAQAAADGRRGADEAAAQRATEVEAEEAWLLWHRPDALMHDIVPDQLEFLALTTEGRRKLDTAFEMRGTAAILHEDGLLRRARFEFTTVRAVPLNRRRCEYQRDRLREQIAWTEQQLAKRGVGFSKEGLASQKSQLEDLERLLEPEFRLGRLAGRVCMRLLEWHLLREDVDRCRKEVARLETELPRANFLKRRLIGPALDDARDRLAEAELRLRLHKVIGNERAAYRGTFEGEWRSNRPSILQDPL